MERSVLVVSHGTCFADLFLLAIIFTRLVRIGCSNYMITDDPHAAVAEEEETDDYILMRDKNYDYNISVKSCAENYPFTYSKCLQLCDSKLEATCVDDQLCLCDLSRLQKILNAERTTLLQLKNLGALSGTSKHATCFSSDFCEDLCQNDEKLEYVVDQFKWIQKSDGRTYVLHALGALCKSLDDDDMQSCMCSITSQQEPHEEYGH